jgi:hypothetical protein
MKKIVLILLSFFLCLSACKNETKSNDNLESKKYKIELPKQKVNDSKNENQKKIPLSKAQLEVFFPENIGSNKRFSVFVIPGESMATASYGSYQSSYSYSVKDAIKDDSVIKNFEISYNANYNAPKGTEFIIKERSGFKTIAFLQPEIKRYDIQFVYKNRFKIVLEGPEHPDVLWSYIKKSDLEKLDNY